MRHGLGRSAVGRVASLLAVTAALGALGLRASTRQFPPMAWRCAGWSIYRNGVAYFERAGHIEADKVEFKVKREEVGDFLATLAVIEKGGSSVRSASFPIKVDDHKDQRDDEGSRSRAAPGAAARRRTEGDAPSPSAPAAEEGQPNKLETVVLELDGKAHDLQVGYVAETPVWRPSYRLIIEKGASTLQAWGIVQNLSGEDWTGVKLSLIAGAPLAFEATLGTPVIPPRPTVTDMGEVIASVPRSETSLNQEPMAAPAPAPPPPPPAAEAGAGSLAQLEEEAEQDSSRPARRIRSPKRKRSAPAAR